MISEATIFFFCYFERIKEYNVFILQENVFFRAALRSDNLPNAFLFMLSETSTPKPPSCYGDGLELVRCEENNSCVVSAPDVRSGPWNRSGLTQSLTPPTLTSKQRGSGNKPWHGINKQLSTIPALHWWAPRSLNGKGQMDTLHLGDRLHSPGKGVGTDSFFTEEICLTLLSLDAKTH